MTDYKKVFIDTAPFMYYIEGSVGNPDYSDKAKDFFKSSNKEMLLHRGGTLIEDMYWIDVESGEIVASVLDSKEEQSLSFWSYYVP